MSCTFFRAAHKIAPLLVFIAAAWAAEHPQNPDRFTTTCSPEGHIKADNSRFEPACLVSIYEDSGPNRRIVLFSPKNPQLNSRILSADRESVIVIDPSRFYRENSSIGLNKLLIHAEVVGGDKNQKIEVIGYYEIGKSELTDQDAQKAFALATFDDLAARMTKLFSTSKDLIQEIWPQLPGSTTGPAPVPPVKDACWTILKKANVSMQDIDAACPIPPSPGGDKPTGTTPAEVAKAIEWQALTDAEALFRTRTERAYGTEAPEALAITDSLSETNQSLIGREIGNEIFEVDYNSMKAILTQLKADVTAVTAGTLKPDELNKARYRLLSRVLLIARTLGRSRREVERITHLLEDKAASQQNSEWGEIGQDCPDTAHNLEFQLTRLVLNQNYEAAARACYLENSKRIFADKLRKYMISGTISLRGNGIKFGDTLRISILAAGPDTSGDGFKSDFEIRVTSYGWKETLADSLLFIKRLHITASDITASSIKNADGTVTPPTGLKDVRFAPYPGVTFGSTYFYRNLKDCTLRKTPDTSASSDSKQDRKPDRCDGSPLAEFEKQRYYIHRTSTGERFMHALAPGLGVNATFMSFGDLRDYDPAKGSFTNTNGSNFQLGVGPIVSLFNGQISASYGWNLMAERRRSYYALGFSFIQAYKAYKDIFK